MKYRRSLLPLTPVDQHLVGGWLEAGGEAEETREGGDRRMAPIEAEDELVEVGLQVRPAQPVIDAEPPPLRVGEDSVHPGQDDVRGHWPDHLGVVLDVLERGIPGPAVADEGPAASDCDGDEAAQADAQALLDHGEPGPTRAPALDLDRSCDQEPAFV